MKPRVRVNPYALGRSGRLRARGIPADDAFCALLLVCPRPDLIPSSREDHSLHFNSPRDTFRESRYSSGQEIQPIEVQMGLVGWALDDTSEESKAMVMGVMRQDEVETEASDEEGDDAEEWLEIRLRLAKVCIPDPGRRRVVVAQVPSADLSPRHQTFLPPGQARVSRSTSQRTQSAAARRDTSTTTTTTASCRVVARHAFAVDERPRILVLHPFRRPLPGSQRQALFRRTLLQ